jgi:hypothetical protein
MTRGRPVSAVPTWQCHLHLRLRVGEDDDLIAFLSNLPPRRRTTALKAALRAGGMPAAADESLLDEDLSGLLDDFLK